MSKLKENLKITRDKRKIAKIKFLVLILKDQEISLKVCRSNYIKHVCDIYFAKMNSYYFAMPILFYFLIFCSFLIFPVAYPLYYQNKKKFISLLLDYLNQEYKPKDDYIKAKLNIIIEEFLI